MLVRWFFRLFILLLLLIPVGIIVVAVLCLESTPLVEGEALLSASNVERAKRLLKEHDPWKLRSGEVKTVSMTEEELSLIANHLINRFGSGGATLEMGQDRLTIAASLDLAKLVPGHFINLEADLSADGDVARLDKLRIGSVSIPSRLVRGLVAFGAEHVYRASGVQNAKEVLRTVAMRPQRLDIIYQWQEEIVDAIRNRLVSRTDKVLLRVYNEFLAAEIERQGSELSFTSVVQAIFQEALKRSPSTDPVAENLAAIVVLAAYVNGSSLSTFAPESVDWVKPRRIPLKIHSRRDLVRHFSTSAALAVAGGRAVSDAVGLYKEVEDADGGSGFSFKDLAANKAGIQFGQVAIESEDSAIRLQVRIARGIDDTALIPDISDLEENISDAEFKSRYGGIEGDAYARVVQDIERRIAESVLFRP